MVRKEVEMKEVVLIVPNFFEDRDYERYGIEIFRNNSITIEVWSVVYLLATAKKIMPIQSPTDKIDVYYPKKLSQISEKIKIYKDKSFLLLLNFEGAENIRKLIYRNKCKYYELKLCPALCYDEEFLRKDLINKIRHKLIYENARNRDILIYIVENYLKISYKKLLFKIAILSNLPQGIFYSTFLDKCHVPLLLKNIKSYYIHTLDYDIYLQNEPEITNQKNSMKKKYIVYIDDAETLVQPDNIHYGKYLINSKFVLKHREDLTILFQKIESLYRVEVLIAGHPRVKYKGNEYGDRKILQFQTAQLVKNAEFVIVSRSTSWNFIILYDKPVLFYTTSRKPYVQDISIMEKYLECQAFDISKKGIEDMELKNQIRKIDKVVRQKYIREYVKGKDSKGMYFFQFVADIINSGGEINDYNT